MIEMFTLSRSYKELRERLGVEKTDDIKYLPCVIDIDDSTVDDEHLPYDVIDIVEEYDDITYLSLTNKYTICRSIIS